MSEYLVPLLIIGFLILLNGLFVAAEFAIIAAPRHASDPGGRAWLRIGPQCAALFWPILRSRTATWPRPRSASPLPAWGWACTASTRWPSGCMARSAASPRWPGRLPHTVATVLAIGVLTYLHVVLGEMVPKSLAIQYADTSVLRLDAPMRVMRKIFAPVVLVLNGIGNGVVRLMGIPPVNAQARLFSADELEYLMDESAEVGLMEPAEQLFIENIFDLRQRTVGQVMTRRKQIVGLPVTRRRARDPAFRLPGAPLALSRLRQGAG